MEKTRATCLVVVSLLAGGTLVSCSQDESANPNSKTPAQACAGKPCGAACSACTLASCAVNDLVGSCGPSGLCMASPVTCTLDAGGSASGGSGGKSASDAPMVGGTGGVSSVVPATGGASGTGDASLAGGRRDASGEVGPLSCQGRGTVYDIGERVPSGLCSGCSSSCDYCTCSGNSGVPEFVCTHIPCGTGGRSGTGGAPGSGGASGADGGSLLMRPSLPAECARDEDCCVANDPCHARSYLVGKSEYASMLDSIQAFVAAEGASCVDCLAPKIQVACLSGVCVGRPLSSAKVGSHCGGTSLTDGGSTSTGGDWPDGGTGSDFPKSVWGCGGYSAP